MILLFVLIGLFLLGFGIYIKNDIVQKIAGGCIGVCIFILITLNYNNADTIVYSNEYYYASQYGWNILNEDFSTKEVRQFGFLYLNKLLYCLDFSFSEMRFLSTAALLILLFEVIHKITYKWAVVFLIYLVFPLTMDSIQIRSFFGASFILCGMYLYSLTIISTIKRKMLYILMNFVAISFHSAFVLFVPFVFIEEVYRKKLFYFLMIVGILSPVYASAIMSDSTSLLLAIGLGESPLEGYLAYTDGATADSVIVNPFLYFIKNWLLVISSCVLIVYLKKRTYDKKNNIESQLSRNKLFKCNFIHTTYMMWCYCCILLPLISLTPSMDRIPRTLLLPTYISIAIYCETHFNKGIWIAVICIITVALYFGVYNTSQWMFIRDNLGNNYLF